MNRKIAFAAIALAAPVALALALGWSKVPNSLWYKHGRPTRFGRITNRTMSWLASLGMPLQVTLDVPARQSGRRRSTVLVPAEVDGERYLVSMLGERSDWVKNVRAAAGPIYIRHGRRQEVVLEEVPVNERGPVLKAYLQRAPGGRPHFPVGKDASVEEFERIADQYPVFRVVRVGDRARATPPAPLRGAPP